MFCFEFQEGISKENDPHSNHLHQEQKDETGNIRPVFQKIIGK